MKHLPQYIPTTDEELNKLTVAPIPSSSGQEMSIEYKSKVTNTGGDYRMKNSQPSQ
jgi:hypothetical protein